MARRNDQGDQFPGDAGDLIPFDPGSALQHIDFNPRSKKGFKKVDAIRPRNQIADPNLPPEKPQQPNAITSWGGIIRGHLGYFDFYHAYQVLRTDGKLVVAKYIGPEDDPLFEVDENVVIVVGDRDDYLVQGRPQSRADHYYVVLTEALAQAPGVVFGQLSYAKGKLHYNQFDRFHHADQIVKVCNASQGSWPIGTALPVELFLERDANDLPVYIVKEELAVCKFQGIAKTASTGAAFTATVAAMISGNDPRQNAGDANELITGILNPIGYKVEVDSAVFVERAQEGLSFICTGAKAQVEEDDPDPDPDPDPTPNTGTGVVRFRLTEDMTNHAAHANIIGVDGATIDEEGNDAEDVQNASYWVPGGDYIKDEFRRATIADPLSGRFDPGDAIRCNVAHTGNTTFDTNEASKWDYYPVTGVIYVYSEDMYRLANGPTNDPQFGDIPGYRGTAFKVGSGIFAGEPGPTYYIINMEQTARWIRGPHIVGSDASVTEEVEKWTKDTQVIKDELRRVYTADFDDDFPPSGLTNGQLVKAKFDRTTSPSLTSSEMSSTYWDTSVDEGAVLKKEWYFYLSIKSFWGGPTNGRFPKATQVTEVWGTGSLETAKTHSAIKVWVPEGYHPVSGHEYVAIWHDRKSRYELDPKTMLRVWLIVGMHVEGLSEQDFIPAVTYDQGLQRVRILRKTSINGYNAIELIPVTGETEIYSIGEKRNFFESWSFLPMTIPLGRAILGYEIDGKFVNFDVVEFPFTIPE